MSNEILKIEIINKVLHLKLKSQCQEDALNNALTNILALTCRGAAASNFFKIGII